MSDDRIDVRVYEVYFSSHFKEHNVNHFSEAFQLRSFYIDLQIITPIRDDNLGILAIQELKYTPILPPTISLTKEAFE